jgi:hypothetical protein
LVDEFRKLASSYLDQPGHFVIVSHLRKAIGQQLAGAIRRSPPMKQKPTASSSSTSRYEYPPVWVKTTDIFRRHEHPRRAGRLPFNSARRLRSARGRIARKTFSSPLAAGAHAVTQDPTS